MMRLQQIGSNQTECFFSDGTVILFSYSTPVAAFVPGRPDGSRWIKTGKRWSTTTSRHINAWAKRHNVTLVEIDQDELYKIADRG